jgi:hypothetical protein
MILKTPVLKAGDILINDRGFICRELINRLKKVHLTAILIGIITIGLNCTEILY